MSGHRFNPKRSWFSGNSWLAIVVRVLQTWFSPQTGLGEARGAHCGAPSPHPLPHPTFSLTEGEGIAIPAWLAWILLFLSELVEGYEFEASSPAARDELHEGVEGVLGAVVEEYDSSWGEADGLSLKQNLITGVVVVAGVVGPQHSGHP